MSESRGFREHCSRVVVALVLAALVWPSGARAQGTAIDEDIAVARALEGNPSLRAALIEHQRALRAIRGEEARYGFTLQLDGQLTIGDTPTLSRSAMGGLIVSTYSEQVALGAELERIFEWGMLATARLQGGRTFRRGIFVPGMDPISVGPGYTVDLVLTVTQPFLRGFGDRNGLAQLRALRVERDRTEASRVRQASSLVRDVRTAYWELWYARASLDVQRAALEVAQQHEADARARLELGGIAAADVLAFATRVASLTEAVVAAEADLARRSTELSRQLGGEAGIAVGSLEPGTEAPPAISPRAAAELEAAIANAPEVREAEAQVAAAREAARVAGSALEPRLDAQGQLAMHGMGYDDVGAAFGQWATFGAVTGLVSLVFEAPLDDTQHRMEVERAELAVDAAEAQLEAARSQVLASVRTLLDQHAAAQRRLELARSTVSLAEQLLEAERGRYELGARVASGVLDAETELRSARLRELRARVDLMSAELAVQHALGELVTP